MIRKITIQLTRKDCWNQRLCSGSAQTFLISEITKCNTSFKAAHYNATDTDVLHGLSCILHYRIKKHHSHCKVPLKNSFALLFCLFSALVLFWHSMKQLQLFPHTSTGNFRIQIELFEMESLSSSM